MTPSYYLSDRLQSYEALLNRHIFLSLCGGCNLEALRFHLPLELQRAAQFSQDLGAGAQRSCNLFFLFKAGLSMFGTVIEGSEFHFYCPPMMYIVLDFDPDGDQVGHIHPECYASKPLRCAEIRSLSIGARLRTFYYIMKICDTLHGTPTHAT